MPVFGPGLVVGKTPISETFGSTSVDRSASLFFGGYVNGYLASLVFVILAEMGDKTQLLAMAFASRYRWQTVMWGVFVATLVNHLLAVLAGNYLTALFPMEYVQIAAAASFIIFGLWTVRGDTLRGEDKRFNFSPFWTVAVAFFFAEMGDKTQLATVALASRYGQIIPVWFGTTSGMLVADALGIVVGIVMGKSIPERTVKWFAAIIFVAFGLIALYDVTPPPFRTVPVVAGSIGLSAIMIVVVARLTGQRD
jgi:Ca2+/H+ antiporter, TMEM165/GDT1 family